MVKIEYFRNGVLAECTPLLLVGAAFRKTLPFRLGFET